MGAEKYDIFFLISWESLLIETTDVEALAECTSLDGKKNNKNTTAAHTCFFFERHTSSIREPTQGGGILKPRKHEVKKRPNHFLDFVQKFQRSGLLFILAFLKSVAPWIPIRVLPYWIRETAVTTLHNT